MMTYSKNFVCLTEENTKLLAEKIAKVVRKGDIFALYGTLGAGKSTFSRYFIRCLNGADEVPSPTFTLVQTYETSDFDIYHYDMYRLKSPEDAYELDIEEAFYNGVSLIEWPEKISYLLPRDVWSVAISTKDGARIFDITVTDKEKYQRLTEALDG